MPRGFLVKRSRRPGGSYRARLPAGPPARLAEEAPLGPATWPEPPRPPEPVREAAAAAAPPVPPGAPPRPPRPKKPKAARRPSVADDETTSPVLGLRIKAASEAGCEGPRAARPTPLGEFVCQLCKEPYGDPLALAQHRCSRIVRVEYRCPECHKIFSCPANLASHRRWHKPRPSVPAGPARDKENSSGGRDQHRGAPDSSCGRDPPAAQLGDAPGTGAPPGELFLCPYCRKTFRRQAYLRKHLGTHQAPGPGAYRRSPPPRASPPPPPPPPITFPCHLCGAHFPSADIRDKHRLWHAVREELLLPLAQPEGSGAQGEQQIFSCKHCPATFFGSPGLTRHINKCHPSENRQVLLLQMPVRPGC